MANNFLPFCGTDSGTNLLTQEEYAISTGRTSGNQPGVASSKLNNKALRQASFVASQQAQFISDQLASDVLDDGVTARLLSQIRAVQKPYAPKVTKYTSGSGTFNSTYIFFIASGSATAAATYTNSGNTFTVVSTVAAGTEIQMTGNGAPSVSGTLTKSGGTGDATLTFYAVRAPLYLVATLVGAGGGGGGGAGSSGGTGGNTTFGAQLVASGGVGAESGLGKPGGAGGAATLGTGPVGIAVPGGDGQGASGSIAAVVTASGNGGSSALGGAGGGGINAPGGAGKTNSGGGGGGGGGNAGGGAGAGAGAGGYIRAVLYTPSATYAYAVGAGGGVSGQTVFSGGAGAAGLVVVEEHYQ